LVFPSDYRATELAGKTAIFKVDVKSVQEGAPAALDEEFCKAFGVQEGGIEKLRAGVKDNMRREMQQALGASAKQAVMDALFKANPVDVPNALIEAQVQDMQADAMRRAGIKDVAQAPPREPFEAPARRRAALGLLLSEIIKREKITLDRARVNTRLEQITASYGDAAGLRRAYEQNPDAMRQVESIALEDQVVDWVLAHGMVRDVASSFQEVMKF
jgi:trigger factor